MMPTFESQFAELTAWLDLSSTDDTSPMGWPVARGPYAQPVGITLDDMPPDLAAAVALGCLPLLVPADLPAEPPKPPQGQPVTLDRALHVIWKAGAAKHRPEGFPACAVVAVEAGQTLRQACAAAGIYPDADRLVIGLPLYAMPPRIAMKLRPELPVR